MKTIEQAIELHQALDRLAPHPGAVRQGITSGTGLATNAERHNLTLQTLLAKGDIPPEDPRWNTFRQGFHCVEVDIRACWGGNHHDGTPRTETEFSIHVLDRLHGGMAQQTWHTSGVEVLDPLSLLT